MEKTVPKKRPKSAARKALEAVISEFDELLSGDALTDKPAKRADIVIEKARALKELLALEAEDRVTETQDTIDRLEAQHADDCCRVTELETENITLRMKTVEVKTVTVQDPEHVSVREQNATLTAALKCVAETLNDTIRPQMAIWCIQKSTPAAARLFCQFAGVDYSAYVQMLSSYKTESELQNVIDKAQREGPAVVFARAALAVRDEGVARSVITVPDTSFGYRPTDPPFIDTRTLSGEEKLRAARELVNGRTLRVVPAPIQTAEENLRSQPREIIGSPDAIPNRERITPVSVSTLDALARREISGGGDFSEWVK